MGVDYLIVEVSLDISIYNIVLYMLRDRWLV